MLVVARLVNDDLSKLPAGRWEVLMETFIDNYDHSSVEVSAPKGAPVLSTNDRVRRADDARKHITN